MARMCKIYWRNGLELYLIAEKFLKQLQLITEIPVAPSIFSYWTIRLWAPTFCEVIVDDYKINIRSPRITNIIENQVLVYNNAETRVVLFDQNKSTSLYIKANSAYEQAMRYYLM